MDSETYSLLMYYGLALSGIDESFTSLYMYCIPNRSHISHLKDVERVISRYPIHQVLEQH